MDHVISSDLWVSSAWAVTAVVLQSCMQSVTAWWPDRIPGPLINIGVP